jgi:hypothetical protein
MATTKERILVTLSPRMARGINVIAKRERMPRATVAAHVLRAGLYELEDDALTKEEERELAKIVLARDVPGAKYLSSKEFWKQAGLHA